MASSALILLPSPVLLLIAALGTVILLSGKPSALAANRLAAPKGTAWGRGLLFWPVVSSLGNKIVPERGADSFGASREGGKRLHAGVDLLTSKGAAIVAIADGRVAGFPTGYVGLDAVAIEHAPPLSPMRSPSAPLGGSDGKPISGILYAEFTRDPKLVVGEIVKAGQVLGIAAASAYGSMLHLEFWQGRTPSAFTPWLAGSPRPIGLLDPTFDLQQLAKAS